MLLRTPTARFQVRDFWTLSGSGQLGDTLNFSCAGNSKTLESIAMSLAHRSHLRDPGSKIIIYMPSAPQMVPYQECSTSSTGPAHRYQIHILTGP